MKSEILKKLYALIGQTPLTTDRRLLTANHIVFPQEAYVPETLSEHRARRAEVIRRIRLAAGFEPEIKFSEKNFRMSNRRTHEKVAIYDVDIETLPGLRLTGNMFFPEDFSGKLPAILCPHGHWKSGRVHHEPRGGVIMRCLQFARMGFAVFAYDMLGYNDNNDLPHAFDRKMRYIADLYGVSSFGLQCANSLRAVDFVASLPEVDADKIGCTGASGGASQSWFIAILDKRIKAVAPVCMFSSHFQGGCDCEEGPLLRAYGLTNFDIMAALAPLPVLLPSVEGDWTRCNPRYEIPRLKEVYKLYNAADRVENFHCHAVHNYNQNTREHVYAWFAKLFLGADNSPAIPEEKITVAPPEILWHGGKKPEPPSEEHINSTFEKLKKVFTATALDRGNDLSAYQESRREILREMIAPQKATKDVVEMYINSPFDIPDAVVCPAYLTRRTEGDTVAEFFFEPAGQRNSEEAFLFVVPQDLADLLPDGRYYNMIAPMLKQGIYGAGIEMLGGKATEAMFERCIFDDDNWPNQSAFLPSFFSMRVQDIVTAYISLQEKGYRRITIFSPAGSAPEVLAACALLNTPAAVIDLDGVSDSVWEKELQHQPLIHKIGGIAGLALINAKVGVVYCSVPEWLKKILAGTPCCMQKSFEME